ncbi:receptor-like protein 33 [Rhododendron vialii]|uniref:receptor-like protein 33 n=1 Tax=Rhododendron vialii TaxID=182163 RepID=UPI00265D84C5|nr:receptor-like protein 33 [Rhododendron vialii]
MKQLPWEGLITLDLRYNLLHGPLPIPPPFIQIFFISNNNLSRQIPSLICNASSLRILDLSHNKLSGAVPQCLENFSSVLLVLNLRSNGFTGTLPLAFAKANQLRSLDLSGNQLEGPLPRSLADCTSLEVLNVGNNKINDTFPYWLETLLELQVLVVRSNRFHGPINTSKSKFPFPKLRIVDLSYNEFNGHLPVTYFEYFQAVKNKNMPGKNYMSDVNSYYYDSIIVTIKGLERELLRIFTIFTTIDFSSNNFSGEIPNVIGKLNSLIVLTFSHDSLTGHIPSSLGDLESLESLDISSNQLTGRIPSQLTSLPFLAFLNLSWNRLHGPILRGYGCGMTLGLFLGSLMFLIGRPKFFVRLAEREKPKKVIRLRRMVTDIVARRKCYVNKISASNASKLCYVGCFTSSMDHACTSTSLGHILGFGWRVKTNSSSGIDREIDRDVSVWGKSKPAESNGTEAVSAKIMFYSRAAPDKMEDAIFREGMEEEKPLPAMEVATEEVDDDVYLYYFF